MVFSINMQRFQSGKPSIMNLIYSNRRLLAFLHDVTVAAISFWLALYLRVSGDLSVLDLGAAVVASVLFTLTCGAVFLANGLYRSIWAFASLRDLMEILRSATIAVAIFLAIAFVTTRLAGVP